MLPAAERLHWSLLIIGVMLLVCLSMLIFYCHHDFVKSKLFCLLFGIKCVKYGGERKKTEYALSSLTVWPMSSGTSHKGSFHLPQEQILFSKSVMIYNMSAHGFISPSYNLTKDCY